MSGLVTHTGKIARLPYETRMELNRRLLDGQTGPEILAWLNALPVVRKRMAELFGSAEINRENLSAWRRGAYQEWLRKGPSECQVSAPTPS